MDGPGEPVDFTDIAVRENLSAGGQSERKRGLKWNRENWTYIPYPIAVPMVTLRILVGGVGNHVISI
jgi:hypothetical protein